MEMIAKVLSEGRQAIVLIPEIALTYQTVMRFYTRFGERVSILNSRMSQGERYDQMERVKKGEVDIMIGPRSALFTPFEKLGLIVIDEEHEPTYKSEQVPRFHARETAIERARMEGAVWYWGRQLLHWKHFMHVNAEDIRCYGLRCVPGSRNFRRYMWQICGKN